MLALGAEMLVAAVETPSAAAAAVAVKGADPTAAPPVVLPPAAAAAVAVKGADPTAAPS